MKFTVLIMFIAVLIGGCSETDSVGSSGEFKFSADSAVYHLSDGKAKIRLTVSNTTRTGFYYFKFDSVRFYGMLEMITVGSDTIKINAFVSPRMNNSLLLNQDPKNFDVSFLGPNEQFSDDVTISSSGTKVIKFFYGNTASTVNFSTFLEKTITIQ